MKQFKINNAYKKMEALAENGELSQLEQWKLYKLRKTLKPHVDFFAEQEGVINDKYREFIDEKGMIHGEPALKYATEIGELNNLDVDMDNFQKPEIRFVGGISFKTAEELEEFIDFIPPEGE